MLKKIEVERVIIDTFIESFKGIYLYIGKDIKEFSSFCKTVTKSGLGFRTWEKNIDFRIVEDAEGNIEDLNITEAFLIYLLRNEYNTLNIEYKKMLNKFKTPRKDFIESTDKVLEVLLALENRFDSNLETNMLLTPTEVFKDICQVQTANKLLKEQKVLIENPNIKGYLPKCKEFENERKGLVHRYDPPHSFRSSKEPSTSIRWTIKGAEEARNVILNSLDPDKLDKYLKKKAKAK